MNPNETRSAEFSADRKYRYTLSIIWDKLRPPVQFIGLNPSTADEVQDDPTIRRCKAFARAWGNGGIIMTNLFAFRATDPKDMKAASNPEGEAGVFITTCNTEFNNRNDFFLYTTALRCTARIACWGTHGAFRGRAVKVRWFMPKMQCLAVTKGGCPSHPLYLKSDLKPIDYNP